VYGRSAEHMVDQVLGIILLVAGVIIAALWLIVRSIRKKKKHKRTLIQMEDK
jgi:predicted outer membrane lipoprotein